MPVRFLITAGNQADCTQARTVGGVSSPTVMADKAYDTDTILEYLLSRQAVPVIPLKSNRKTQRDYDKYLYKLWHLVENYFQKVKSW